MKNKKQDQHGTMRLPCEVAENVINAINSRDTTAMDQLAAQLKTMLDKHREKYH